VKRPWVPTSFGSVFVMLTLLANCARAESASPVEVRVELPKREYTVGEAINFVVTANQDCYFLVYTIDPDDKVEVHDPVVSGGYMGHPLLKAGERRQIPAPDAPGRAIVRPPGGHYEIGAFCSREELSKLGLSQIQLKEPASGGRRSFKFHLGEKTTRIEQELLGQTVTSYDVRR
jgi:hypothetical protein